MKKFFQKTIVTVMCFTMALCVAPVHAEPGSADDPLITLSYVEDVLIPQMKSYVDSSVANISVEAPLQSGTVVESSGVFNIVNVSKGQTILGDNSSQMILRMGTGKIVATSKGGVADVTAGYDLSDGVDAPANHLLIVPMNDGRGIKMTSDGIIMICGSYSVKR